MDMIQGAEWIVVALLAVGFLISMYLIASVQGDLVVLEEYGVQTDAQAAAMFIELLYQTRHRLDIHDAGNDFAGSMYNSPEVMAVLREQLQHRHITVRCLFNAVGQPLELLTLAQIWRSAGRVDPAGEAGLAATRRMRPQIKPLS